MHPENKEIDRLSIAFDYVLIIEYLSPNERHTGEELFEQINSYAPESVDLIKCSTKNDFFAALKKAENEIATKGIPLIHIEAHGSEWCRENKNAVIGYEGGEQISIHEIFKLLRPINIKSQFNIILAGASCHAAEYLRGIINESNDESQQLLPFVATIGFDDVVEDESVFAFYSNFYYEIIKKKTPFFNAAIESNKLINPNEIAITKYSALEIEKNINSISIDDEANHLIEKVLENDNKKLDFNFAKQLVIDSLKIIISNLFAHKYLPNNKNRFNIKIPN